jgi:hypothetical protein
MKPEQYHLHILRTMPDRDLEDGVYVYTDHMTDMVGCDFSIAADDAKGLEIFRRFCAELYEHYRANPGLIYKPKPEPHDSEHAGG